MSDKFSISPTEIKRLDGSKARTQPDFVVVEEPLQLFIGVVNAQLLKGVVLKDLKAKNVQDANETP